VEGTPAIIVCLVQSVVNPMKTLYFQELAFASMHTKLKAETRIGLFRLIIIKAIGDLSNFHHVETF
jgi:hypothetical protein